MHACAHARMRPGVGTGAVGETGNGRCFVRRTCSMHRNKGALKVSCQGAFSAIYLRPGLALFPDCLLFGDNGGGCAGIGADAGLRRSNPQLQGLDVGKRDVILVHRHFLRDSAACQLLHPRSEALSDGQLVRRHRQQACLGKRLLRSHSDNQFYRCAPSIQPRRVWTHELKIYFRNAGETEST